jgi:hypothetical protein
MKNYTEVYLLAKEALENKDPWALIRLGDGEYMCMSQNKIDYVMNRQFNYTPSQHNLDTISKVVADAYVDADIIGVPTKFHREECGSYWAKAEEYLNKIRPETENIETCSIDVHSELLHSGLLDELIMSQDELIYVSGRNLNEGFKRKYPNLKSIKSFIVSAEQKFEPNKAEEKHYPDQFYKCIDWIESLDAKGKLCLVGAGILGKFYSSLLKKQGGVVCEIGHVFDSWAGKCTRGKGRGANAVDNRYKL